MRKPLGNLLLWAAALCLVLVCLPRAGAAAQTGTCGDVLTWAYDDATCTLTIGGKGEMTEFSDLGYEVPWEGVRSQIKALVVEAGVTSISGYAFSHCTALTQVTLSEGLERLDDGAFAYCTALTSFVIPDSVTEVSYSVFQGCSGIKALTLGSGLEYVEGNVIGYCSNLEALTVRGYMTRTICSLSGVTVYGWNGSYIQQLANEEGYSFVCLGGSLWTDGITNADQPALDEATNIMTVRTARELAWVAWKAQNGNTLSAYTIELAGDIDLAGKVWIPMDGFGGVLDGKGHTISNLFCPQGGLMGEMNRGSLRNVYLRDFQVLLMERIQSVFATGWSQNVYNCGAVGKVSGDHTELTGEVYNCYCAAVKDGSFVGKYSDESGAVRTITEAQLKSTDFLDALNVLMENVWDWKQGEDGYPVLDPTSSRSWCSSVLEVTPQNDTYYIGQPEELAWIAQLVNGGDTLAGKTVRLQADLDLSGKYWTPIGLSTDFMGTFDGGGHTITGLRVGTAKLPHSSAAGLIGSGIGSVITGVRLEDAAVYGDYVTGGLAAYASTVTDCSVSGIVSGGEETGGLVGYGYQWHWGDTADRISRCYASCTVSGSSTGGLIGYTQHIPVSDCYAIGAVQGKTTAGGLVGNAIDTITNCYAACDVNCVQNMPGMLAGFCSAPENLIGCYWSSDNLFTQDGVKKTAVGVGYGSTEDPTFSRTLAQLKTQSTFSGWDFTGTWAISASVNGGLPYLRSFDSITVPLKGLSLSDAVWSMKTGESHWLTVTTTPINATAALTWKSSNQAVATVSPAGKITALTAGAAVITVSGGGYSASCTVTVTARAPQEYKIEGLTLEDSDGAPLTAIPAGGFYARATVTKTEDAGSAVAVLATYTAAGKLLNLYFLEANVPVGITYSLGVWIENSGGGVGQVKVFLLPTLTTPAPLSAAAGFPA